MQKVEGKSVKMVEQRWDRWSELAARFKRGDKFVLDGGTGSEVEQLAGSQACTASGWSVAQNLTHPEVVKQVHRNFLDAGADIITANTYATNQHVMDAAGLGKDFERANRVGVQLAVEARDEWAAANDNAVTSGARMLPLVAGSVSCHAPGNEVDKLKGILPWPETEAAEMLNYTVQGQLLVDCGVDLLFTELLWNKLHAMRCVKALATVDVPLWLGLACYSDNAMLAKTDHREARCVVHQANNPQTLWPVKDAVGEMLAANSHIVGINVMHTTLDRMLPALKAVREAGWEGPMGAYPEFGEWLRTGWATPVPLAPSHLAEVAAVWHSAAGPQMIGGCCGIRPDHIAALRGWADAEESVKV